MTVEQISVFLENKPGKLAAFTQLLRGKHIDIRVLFIAESENYGILRIIVDDVPQTTQVLSEAGYIYKVTPVVAVPFKDVSGSLSDVMTALGEDGINIEYMYAFTSRRKDKAYAVLRVAENEKAIDALIQRGYTPVSQQDLSLDE